MIIGVPKEIKNQEYRVGLTPSNAHALVQMGHQVYVESNAGSAIGYLDEEYFAMGAQVLPDASSVFGESDMIVKVKEPQASEIKLLKDGQLLFTYLHLAPDVEQTNALLASNAIAIAYETVTSSLGGLPLLAPMSEVAGRLSIQAAATYLQKRHGGPGMLLGGVPGVSPATVLILGAGVVGSNALQIAVGMGANVTIVDKNLNRLRELDVIYGNRIKTRFSEPRVIEELLREADVVVGGVLIPGASAPKLIQKQHLNLLKPGSVFVDVAIDQGGCFETSRPTTHDDPIYVEEGVTHYCVANMPGAVPKTSTIGLTNATFPYVCELAQKGLEQSIEDNIHLKNGLSIYKGSLTCQATALSQGKNYCLI